MSLLARVNFDDPVIWGILIGWVMSVTLHEFAHGLVAWWGGDYTIREKGGLTLNPLQYVDPLMSLILPTVFLLMGGIPLPGGATFIRRDLLRSREWEAGASAAGPAMNLILFGLLAIPLLPQFGWIDPRAVGDWTTAQKFVAAMCFLQLMTAILNLIPVPGLDGFGIIAPYLDEDLRIKLTTPPVSTLCLVGYFLLLWQAPGFIAAIARAMHAIMGDYLFLVSASGMRAIFWN